MLAGLKHGCVCWFQSTLEEKATRPSEEAVEATDGAESKPQSIAQIIYAENRVSIKLSVLPARTRLFQSVFTTINKYKSLWLD